MLKWPWNWVSRSKSLDISDTSSSRLGKGKQAPTPSRVEQSTQTEVPSPIEKGTQTDTPSRVEQGTQTDTGEPFVLGSKVSVSSNTAAARFENRLPVEEFDPERRHPSFPEQLPIEHIKHGTVKIENSLQRNSLKPILETVDFEESERVTDFWRQATGNCGGSIRSRGSVEPPPIPEKTTAAAGFYPGPPTPRPSSSPRQSIRSGSAKTFVRDLLPASNSPGSSPQLPFCSSAFPRPSQAGSPRPPSSVFEGPPISIAAQPNPWQGDRTKGPNTSSTASQVGNIDSGGLITRHNKPPSIRLGQIAGPSPRFPIRGISSEFPLAVPSRRNSTAANPFTDYEPPVASGSTPDNPPVQSSSNAANPPAQAPGQGDSNRTPDDQHRTGGSIRTRDSLRVKSCSDTMKKESWPHVENFLREVGDAHPWGRSGYFLELVLRALQAQLAAGIPWALLITALAFSGDHGLVYGILSIPVLITLVFTILALLSPGSFGKPLFMIGEVGTTVVWLVFIISIKTQLLDTFSSRDSSKAILLAHEGRADRILRWYGAGVVCVNGVFLLLRGVLCLVGRARSISAGFGKLVGGGKMKTNREPV